MARSTARPGPDRASGEPIVRWTVAPNPGPLTLDGTRSYAVGETDLVLVDPGPAVEGQLELLSELVAGRAVTRILLTHSHADHSGAAAGAAQVFGAPIAASAATLERCGLEGLELADGDRIPLDGGARHLTTLAAPGHAADHLVFLLEPSRALFTGDLVLGRGSSVVLHPDGNVGDCLATFERLLALRPGVLYPGHGPTVEDGVARIAEYRDHRLARHAQVSRAVQEGARTVADVREVVYGALDPGLARAADASVRAHLAWMRECGDDVASIDGLDLDGPPGVRELEP